jgi:hypothetical protein
MTPCIFPNLPDYNCIIQEIQMRRCRQSNDPQCEMTAKLVVFVPVHSCSVLQRLVITGLVKVGNQQYLRHSLSLTIGTVEAARPVRRVTQQVAKLKRPQRAGTEHGLLANRPCSKYLHPVVVRGQTGLPTRSSYGVRRADRAGAVRSLNCQQRDEPIFETRAPPSLQDGYLTASVLVTRCEPV